MDAVTAKQFLISKILQEAESSHVQLSEVERKMLYFTEIHPSLPDIREVNAEFERDYDADKYENKIAQLLSNARARDTARSPGQEHAWNEALDALRKEDHYILVMVGLAFGYRASSSNGHRVRDFLIYVSIGIALVLFFVLKTFWRARH
jgi:hypothetical protein